MTTPNKLPDAIAACVPYDGPHTTEKVTDAAEALPGLVRYLNNATRNRETLTQAATTDRVLGGVGAAARGLVQLFGQLADEMDRKAHNDSTLYDDRRDRPASETAAQLAQHLRSLRFSATQLGADISDAKNLSTHLGNRSLHVGNDVEDEE